MRKFSYIPGLLFVIAFLIFIFGGCGGSGGLSSGSGDKGYVNMQVSYPQDSKGGNLIKDYSSDSSLYVSYYLIDVYEAETTAGKLVPLRVENKDSKAGEPVVPTTKIEYPETTATIFNIPVGTMNFVAYGYDQEGEAVLYGTSTVKVTSGANDPVEIQMSYIGDKPIIKSISPDEGYVGDTLTIYGINFGSERADSRAGSTVSLNGVEIPEDNYVSWSDTQIRFTVPYIGNTGSVVVTVNGQKSNSDITFTRNRKWTMEEMKPQGGFAYYSDYYTVVTALTGDVYVSFFGGDTLGEGMKCFLYRFDPSTLAWSLETMNDENYISATGVNVDQSGNLLYAYARDNGADDFEMYSMYQAKGKRGWEKKEIPLVDIAREPKFISLFFDSQGNRICIYSESPSSGKYYLYRTVYDSSTGAWETPTSLYANEINSSQNPKTFQDSSGVIHCIFSDSSELYYVKYTPSQTASKGTWSSAKQIGLTTGYTIRYFNLDVMDQDVMVIFTVSSQGIYYNRYTGGAWEKGTDGAKFINSSLDIIYPQIAYISSGKAMLAYRELKSGINIKSNVKTAYFSNSSWANATTIYTADDDYEIYKMIMLKYPELSQTAYTKADSDYSYTAYLTFPQVNNQSSAPATHDYQLYDMYKTSSSGWSDKETVESDNGSGNFYPSGKEGAIDAYANRTIFSTPYYWDGIGTSENILVIYNYY